MPVEQIVMKVVKDAETPADTAPTPGRVRRRYLQWKIAIEWVVALVLLIAHSPIIAFMALLAKLSSPGPAFYKQTRSGLGGRPFSMLKIRTMRNNCEAGTGAVWSGNGDPRVTRLGRFLRETHLDELPQLWNVLRGEMALIGPRPERPELVAKIEQAIPQYRQRLAVRPGMTGLAQVQRPADVDLEDVQQKLAYDLCYIRRLSLWLDMRIVVCTVFHLTGLTLNAFGKLFVKSYGDDAERDVKDLIILTGRAAADDRGIERWPPWRPGGNVRWRSR